jgi:glycosyltransferase involved in cell wall biosynthesis
MRVGLIVTEDIPEAGGSFTYVSTILQALIQLADETEHEFVVFGNSPTVPTLLQPQSRLSYISLFCPPEPQGEKIARNLQRIGYLMRHPSAQFHTTPWHEQHLLELLKSSRIDLIWQLSPGTVTFEYPFITTLWDLAHRIHPYFPEVGMDKVTKDDARERLYQQTLPRATYIFTGTAAGKAEIEHFYQVPANRIKVLAFPTPEFALDSAPPADPQILVKYNLPERYLFYPAQFWAHKNHVNLLLALKALADRDGIAPTIVFSGSDKGNRQFVESVITELGLTDRVKFLGFIPQSDLVQVYRQAFALVFVTFFGPDNLPPLEAFGLGCPVIASKVAGAVEQLGDAAILIDPQDPLDIAAAIKTLWESPELRQQLIDRGFERSRQWTNKDYVRSVFTILDEFASIRRCWPNSKVGQPN